MKLFRNTLMVIAMTSVACTQINNSDVQNSGAVGFDGSEELSGEIKDFYCGGLEDFKTAEPGYVQSDNNDNLPIDGRCVFLIESSYSEKIAVIASYNSWLTQYVPHGESHEIVVGREANFSACENPDEELMDRIRSAGWPAEYSFAQCHPRSTELSIPNNLMIKPEEVQGTYSNRRGDRAEVTVEIFLEETPTSSAVFDVSVEYIKADDSTAYIDFESDDLLWFNNTSRPYFSASYKDDCDSPDCYNTDGIVKFLQNRNGSYTLFLEFSHYNNAPMEDGDGGDFIDTVWLKKD